MQTSRIGPFALEEPLGAADSNVLRGVHVEMKRAMAVKLLDRRVIGQPMGGGNFAGDVQRLKKLVHPHVVRTYGGAVEEGQPYLVFEYLPGESLDDRLERRGKLAWETAVEIAEPICEALAYLHSQDWVHRRLTPRVLVGDDGLVKLAGLDCVWSDHDQAPGLRIDMSVAHYLSPEQFRGRASATLPACDMYSVGVLLYRCLTGDLPWDAQTPRDLILARRASPAPRVSATVLDCPVWLDLLVAKLLEKKRSRRLGSADETLRAIAVAKRKVATGAGASKAAMEGRTGALTSELDRSELRKLRSKPQESAPDASPFYERTWFLLGSLAAIIGFVFWITRPSGEDELFAKALPLMQSEKATDWRRADDQYLTELRERFPNTKYADQLQEFDQRLAMHRAEQRVENLDRFGREPQSEAERRYAKAWRLERFGDRLAAWTQYEAIVELFGESDDPSDRAFANLARRQAAAIEAGPRTEPHEGQALVEGRLAEARALIDEGKLIAARRILRSVERLYRDNRELAPLIAEARRQLRELDGADSTD